MNGLKQWMADNEVTQDDFAHRLHISQGFISDVLSGKKRFSPELAARVEKMTHGKVSFLELQHPRYRKAANG